MAVAVAVVVVRRLAPSSVLVFRATLLHKGVAATVAAMVVAGNHTRGVTVRVTIRDAAGSRVPPSPPACRKGSWVGLGWVG